MTGVQTCALPIYTKSRGITSYVYTGSEKLNALYTVSESKLSFKPAPLPVTKAETLLKAQKTFHLKDKRREFISAPQKIITNPARSAKKTAKKRFLRFIACWRLVRTVKSLKSHDFC
mgnify:CR=1 FL=1